MLVFKESYFKSGKTKQLLKSFKSTIQLKCSQLEKNKLDLSNINSSSFMKTNSKDPINYWKEVEKFNGKLAVHSFIDNQEFDRAVSKCDELLRSYNLMYNNLDPIVLDTQLDKIYSSLTYSTNFTKIFDQYSEILAQSLYTKNFYMSTKCIVYLSKAYLDIGQFKFAGELADYALKLYKQSKLECTHILYLILEIITRVNEPKTAIYRSVQTSYIDQLQKEVSKYGHTKLDFISLTGEIKTSNMMNYFQNASLTLNESKYLVTRGLIYRNIEANSKSINILDGLLQANDQISSSDKYIPYSGSYRMLMAYANYYRACFMLEAHREAISSKLFEKAFLYVKTYEYENLKMNLSKLAYSIFKYDIDTSEKELNRLKEMNFQRYPIVQLNLLNLELKYLMIMPKEDNKKLNKIIEKYSELIKFHEQYIGQPYSELVYNINNELSNAGLKSVINTQLKKK